MDTRRNFLKKATFAGIGMAMIPDIAKAAVGEQKGVSSKNITLKKDSVILFQGD